jgi:hypothetical protein
MYKLDIFGEKNIMSCKDMYDDLNVTIDKIEKKAQNDPELNQLGEKLERDFKDFKSKCMK